VRREHPGAGGQRRARAVRPDLPDHVDNLNNVDELDGRHHEFDHEHIDVPKHVADDVHQHDERERAGRVSARLER
jgi:hypothetical protein